MVSDQNIAFVDTFLALQLTGAVLFALIVLSACIFRSAKRHPIFFSFCISWIVFGLSYSLLLFAGQQYKRPDRILCTIQAALIYAVPFLELGASLGLTIHLLLNVLAALSPSAMKKKSYPTFINVLVTLPWVIWTGIFVGVLAFGILHEQQVSMSPNHTYCVIQDSAIPKITAIGVTVGCTGILAVEFTIGALLYRNRAIVNIFSQSLGMAIRIFVFTILGFGAISIGIVFAVTRTRGVQFDVIIAVLPPAAALTFGTQMDLLAGWMCWKRPRPIAPFPEQTILTFTTVDSTSSQIAPSIRRPSASGRPSLSRPSSPHPIPNEATSFLHF